MKSTRVSIASVLAVSAILGIASQPSASAQTVDVPATDIPGLNDWSCVPSEDHPEPVILVHGTGGDVASTWGSLAPDLADQGYCVFALNYGGVAKAGQPSQYIYGVADIASSSRELASFVDTVRTNTGSQKVDMVGFSQGGTLARQYLKFDGGAAPTDPASNKVNKLVTLGATNHGTTFNGLLQAYYLLVTIGVEQNLASELLFSNPSLGEAGMQQLEGSKFLTSLNSGPDVLPGIDYTVIATQHDQVVTPPSSTFLSTAGEASVKNIWLQDGCESNLARHQDLPSDPRTKYLVQTALDPDYAADAVEPC